VGNWLTKEDWWLQPVSHWKFDEGEGSTAYDSVGDNDGTIYGAQWTSGIIEGALDFDGDGDYVDVGNDSSLKPPLPVTFSTWIKLSNLGNTQYIIALDDQTSRYYGILFWVRAEDNLGVSYGDGGEPSPGNRRSKVGTTALNAGTWYHVAAIIRGATDMDLYINGTDDGGAYSGAGGSLAYSSGSSLIGMMHNSQYFLGGQVDDVRVYDRALSAEEILELYLEGWGEKAFDPNPADQATNVDPNTILIWSPGKDALSHDVYFGTDYNDVNDANIADPNVYMGNQDSNSWDPCGLELETTYYWRIDEVGPSDTYKGDVWSFTTWVEFDPNLGLISWWMFDEGAGTTADDSAGDNDGTLVGDPVWTSGQIGGALDFDGDDDYVDVGDPIDDSLDFGAGDSFSISAWVKTTDENGQIVYKRRCTGVGGHYEEGYRLHLTTGKPSFGIEDTSDNGTQISGSTIVTNNEWHHVVAVRDTATDRLYIYLDGSSDATPVTDVTLGTLDTDRSLEIGRADATSPPGLSYHDGKIDDVRIYERALSAEEVLQLYLEGAGPISHWMFDEGTGSTAHDSAGDNDGTIYGAQWTSGQINGALDFDGDGDYVDVGNDSSLKPPLPLTLCAWISFSQNGAVFISLDDWSSSTYYGVVLNLNAASHVSVNFGDGNGSGGSSYRRSKTGTTVLIADTWYQAAAVIRGATDMDIYINGMDDGGSYSGSGDSLAYSSGNASIGTSSPDGPYFDGKIDDVRIYDRVLSAEEVWQLYQDGLN
jgi:hypothetical protein